MHVRRFVKILCDVILESGKGKILGVHLDWGRIVPFSLKRQGIVYQFLHSRVEFIYISTPSIS